MLSTDIRRAGGQRLPQPLRLVMHLPAGHPAGHQTSRERANHVNSRPLHPPWAATRIGIEYVGISRRGRPVFLPDFDASGRTRTWVLPMEGERHNHYATCLTSRRTVKRRRRLHGQHEQLRCKTMTRKKGCQERRPPPEGDVPPKDRQEHTKCAHDTHKNRSSM